MRIADQKYLGHCTEKPLARRPTDNTQRPLNSEVSNKNLLTKRDLEQVAKVLGIDIKSSSVNLDSNQDGQVTKAEVLYKIGNLLNHLEQDAASWKQSLPVETPVAVVRLSRDYLSGSQTGSETGEKTEKIGPF
jgi:hypothetical protein